MTAKNVLVEIDQRQVALVTLNRADKHNAFNENVIAELNETFSNLRNNSNIRAMVLKAEGKSFSAGADLDWMRRMADYRYSENVADAKLLATMLHQLNSLPFPTIARVHGAAYGGGVGLVACCDIVFATQKAKFCLSEVKLGLIPGTVSPYVIAAMGERQARRYFISAEMFDAVTARECGLVSNVVDESELDARIDDCIAQLLKNGPQAMHLAKQLVFDVANRPIDESLMTFTSEAIANARESQEGREGVAAFLAKKPPPWQHE